jgi:organic hydroperoxide reductase OsmC/OhrA
MSTYQKNNAASGSAQKGVTVRYTAKTHTSGGRRGGVSHSDSVPGLEREVAQAIVDATHGETCAYSNATRGNIEVTLNVV